MTLEAGSNYNFEDMAELERHLEPALLEYEKNRYRISLAEILERYDELKNALGIKSFDFPPSYEVKTSANIELTIFSAVAGRGDVKTAFIIALDEKGNVLGHRRQIINEGNNEIISKGYISVGERGKGVAMPIEAAATRIMQSESSKLQKPLRWVVSNTNLDQLEAFNKKAQAEKDSEKKSFLNLLAFRSSKEQARFKKIYGAGGLLGFDQNLEKVFLPKELSSEYNAAKVSLVRQGNEYIGSNTEEKTTDYIVLKRQKLIEIFKHIREQVNA